MLFFCRYQLEQQAAELAKEVSRLRTEGEQEMFVTESAGVPGMLSSGCCWVPIPHTTFARWFMHHMG